MSIESSVLYQEMIRRIGSIPAAPFGLKEEFDRLRHVLQEHGKYIVLLFPEYTPHDPSRHLDHLFSLADRVLGADLYGRLNATELIVLAFSLYAHDWGMAVSGGERDALEGKAAPTEFALVPGEPAAFLHYREESTLQGFPPEDTWSGYLRKTHGARSGARLRRYLEPLGAAFAEAVAKAAEGHMLDVRDIRDVEQYPIQYPLFGETINLAAISVYVRIVDLLDVGEDRTPFALWKFVAPKNSISAVEWKKHRALSPVTTQTGPTHRRVLIGGTTGDADVYAALADLRAWVSSQFQSSIAHLRNLGEPYDLDLDSQIEWAIRAKGFEPVLARFEPERSAILGLLSAELYEGDPFAFVRELLQNSVDAIDTRKDVVEKHGVKIDGRIDVSLWGEDGGLVVEWTDNGVGMDAHVISAYFSTIGRSWYRSSEFRKSGGKHDPISKFGVGVLSCFSVSDSLGVKTRKDPYMGASAPGFTIEIPDRKSFFRVRRAENLPIGTTIQLKIQKPHEQLMGKNFIVDVIRNVAGYVEHEIRINSEAGKFLIARPGEEFDGQFHGQRLPYEPRLQVKPHLSADSEFVERIGRIITVKLGSRSGDYEGHYSVLFPAQAEHWRYAGSKTWELNRARVSFRGANVDSGGRVFVKGVLMGPTSQSFGVERFGRVNTPGEQLFGASYGSDWVSAKLSLNIRKPSLVVPNLARTEARFVRDAWMEEVWHEIAERTHEGIRRESAEFDKAQESARVRAVMVGSYAVFAGLPVFALARIVQTSDAPALIMGSGGELCWMSLGEVVRRGEVMEAPYELNYNEKFLSLAAGGMHRLSGWKGPDVFLDAVGSVDATPWMRPALRFFRYQLRNEGYVPTNIVLVKSPSKEKVPLVCRVWKRHPAGLEWQKLSQREKLERWSRERSFLMPDVLSLISGDNAPELVHFPESCRHVAAMGSRYWNVNHPKICALVESLLNLAVGVVRREVSRDVRVRYDYLNSPDFLGYVVPSRRSASRLALEWPSRLLDLAEEAGVSSRGDGRLFLEDFWPDSVGTYDNPYHYDVSAWFRESNEVGRPI